MDSAQTIYKYLLKPNSQLVDLITYSQSLNNLDKTLKPLINQYIGGDWQLGKTSSTELTLLVSSAETASRLRYQATNLLQEIKKRHKAFNHLQKLHIKVDPVQDNKAPIKSPGKKSALKSSKTGEKYLELLAETIDDPALSASLQRLAKRVSPKKPI